MGAGKVLVIIGAVVGLTSIFLSLFVPQSFGFYRVEGSYGGTVVIGFYITGFGTLASIYPILGIAYMELFGGIMLIGGAITCIKGVVKERKTLGMIFVVDLLVISGADFGYLIYSLGGPADASILWGSFVPAPGTVISWGLWIGSFMAMGAGGLGLIGGALMERKIAGAKEEKNDYMNLDWLKHQYYDLGRTIQDIANDQNVSMITISKWLEKLENTSKE